MIGRLHILVALLSVCSECTASDSRVCEPISIEECRSVLPYQQTWFPNDLFRTAEEGKRSFEQNVKYYKLDSPEAEGTQCKKDALFFFCSSLFPDCRARVRTVTCKSTCETFKNLCRNASFLSFDTIPCDHYHDAANAGEKCLQFPGRSSWHEDGRIASGTSAGTATDPSVCHTIIPEECKNVLPYDYTWYPNYMHKTAVEALQAFEKNVEYYKLDSPEARGTICQKDSLFFFCGTMFPDCRSRERTAICKSTCKMMKSTCKNVSFLSYDTIPCDNYHDDKNSKYKCLQLPYKSSNDKDSDPQRSPKAFSDSDNERDIESRICEPIAPQECRGVLPYQQTWFPNDVFKTAEEAKDSFEQNVKYYKLDLPEAAGTQCKKDALFFICSTMFPDCRPRVRTVTCKSTCETFKNLCRNASFLSFDTIPCDHYHDAANAGEKCLQFSTESASEEQDGTYLVSKDKLQKGTDYFIRSSQRRNQGSCWLVFILTILGNFKFTRVFDKLTTY